VWRGFAFDPGARGVSEHLMLRSGEWAQRHGPVAATHVSLERGGVPPEGAHSRRARQSFARGGVQPSNEAEFRCYGAGPSSEVEFRPRDVGAGCLLGRWCYLGRGCMRSNLPLVSSFVFLLFCEEMGFSLVIRGPLWLSPTVALELLQWYPLGTHRG
jgi:hypothetical protein